MNRLTLVVSTRNRLDKLKRMLDSIEYDNIDFPFLIIIVCDADKATYGAMLKDERVGVSKLVDSKTPKGSVFCRNVGTQLAIDGVSWGVDDVVYEPGFFNRAFVKYNSNFPESDGILAFNVLNNKTRVRKRKQSRCGLGMVGKVWLDRYPERKLFCPEYNHFSVQEIALLGMKLNKLILAEDLKVYHLSPAAGELVDRTHIEARKYRQEDKQVSGRRHKEGKIWGWKNEMARGRLE